MACEQNITPGDQGRLTGKLLRGCCLVLVFLLLSGCQTTKVDKWKPVRSQHKNQVHTVVWAAENLPVIAKWYTGAEANWKEIANANPNILPAQLSPGDRILIPSSLLKTRAAMTKTFLEEWLHSAKMREKPAGVNKNGEQAPLLIPKLHKLKQDDDIAEPDAPLERKAPADNGDVLELFGPK